MIVTQDPVNNSILGQFSQNRKFGQNGKLGHSCTNVTKGKLYGSRVSDHAIVHLGLNVSSSAHNCGCMVDGSDLSIIIIIIIIMKEGKLNISMSNSVWCSSSRPQQEWGYYIHTLI